MNHERKRGGFTLIELLIVIAIIAIIASVAFVALDPLRRFRDTRDARRWVDVTAILSAIKVDQVDNGGSYISAITNLVASTTYMIGSDTGGSCVNTLCTPLATTTLGCVDLAGLVTEGYIANIPVSPTGETTWTGGHTGYTVSRASTGSLTVGSCEAENTPRISISR